MLKEFFQKHKFDFLAVAIFLAISCIYFYPALQGYSLKMGDITQFSGMAKESMDYQKEYGESTLWTGTSFSGMPTYMIFVQYVNPIKTVFNLINEGLTFPITAMFFAFLSFYVLGRVLKGTFLISLIGAIAYGLSTYNITIIEAGHTSKMLAIAYIPGVIAGIFMIYRNKNWLLSLGVLALFMSLELMVNHIQMTYYFGFAIVAIIVTFAIKYYKRRDYQTFLKKSGLIFVGVTIGILVNFANYYNAYQFSKKTMRGKPVISISANEKGEDKRTEEEKAYDAFNQTSGLKRDYITQWSYGKSETWNLFISKAKGNNSLVQEVFEKISEENPQSAQFVYQQYQQTQGKVFGGYWGEQPFTSGPNYIGAIVVFLALMYLFFVHSALKWSLLAISILVILLSWGKNLGGSIEDMWLTNFFIDYLPLYSKFRAVSSILAVINLIAPLMAILFLIHLSKNINWAKENIKNLAIGAGVIGLLLLIVIINPSIVGLMSEFEQNYIETIQGQYLSNPKGPNPEVIAEQVINARAKVVTGDALRSLGLIVLTIGFLFLIIKKDQYRRFAFAGIALLVFIDLFTVDKQYLDNSFVEYQLRGGESTAQVAAKFNVPFDKLKAKDDKKKVAQLVPGDIIVLPIYEKWKEGEVFKETFNATPGDYAIFQKESSKNQKVITDFNTKRVELSKELGSDLTKTDIEKVQFEALNFNSNYRVMDLDNPFNSARASYFHKTTGGYSPAKLKRYQDLIDFYIQSEAGYISSKIRTIQQRNPEILQAVVSGAVPLLSPAEEEKIKVLNMLNNKYFLFSGQLIWENPYTKGNAWFVQKVKEVQNNNEEILAIKDVDLSNTTIIHQEFKDLLKIPQGTDSNASVTLESYLPNYLVYNSNSSKDGLVVFSEIYYSDGWKAYIDGVEAPYFRANYILRALNVPAGSHKIEFKFQPKMYDLGNTINLIGFILLIFPFGVYFFKKFRASKSN